MREGGWGGRGVEDVRITMLLLKYESYAEREKTWTMTLVSFMGVGVGVGCLRNTMLLFDV